MATNLNISENQERVPLRIGGGGLLRTITPDDGSPYYVGARAYVTQTASGAIVTVIDKDGTTTATILNGTNGQNGVSISDISLTGSSGLVDTYTITYSNGDTDTFTVTNGQDGADGNDGYSPTATVTKSGDTATITITDINGTTTATVKDGTQANAFTAEYGTTTYADVKDAYDDDAIIICTADDSGNTMVLQLVYFDATNEIFFFAKPNGDGFYWTELSNANGWDDGTRYLASTDVATQLADGLMSALDKQKLDGIASGAEVNVQSDWNQATNTADDYIKNKPTIPSKTSDLVNDSLYARGHIASFHGTCTTGAATAEKAVTCADFKAADLVAGAIIVVSFSETNSAAVTDLTLNVNSTGAYHIKRNSAGTIGNLDAVGNLKASSSYMFYFDGSYWVIAAYYNDTNTNTIGYTIRTNGLQLPVKTQMYRYRICFTSADGEYFVPANASTSTSATASKTVTTEKIDPFGRIVYYNATAAVAVNSYPTVSNLCQQYNGIYLGYSFNRTGAALTLTNHKPVYIKCTPQTDGSAIIDSSTPFVQALPSTADGKIYIFLGVATAATTIEMVLEHPVYEYKGGHIREYTPTSEVSVTQITSTGTKIATVTVDGTATDLYAPSGGGGGGTITDVTVDGTSVVTGTTAAIDLTGKSDVGHTHTKSAITDFPTTVSSFTNDAGYITGVTSTDTPTADTIAEFDSDAHINSEDMSAQDVSDFVDNLNTSAVTLFEDISDKITLDSRWTNLSKFAYRVGKACFFYIEAYASTVTGGTQYILATIADGYRPSITVAHTGHTTNGSFLAQGIVNTFVWAGGDITVRVQNNNGQYVFASGWWILP